MQIYEYAAMDAVAISLAVRSGELSAPEVTEAAIAAIEAFDPKLNALVLKDFEYARGCARHVGRELPLAGVPFLIKDVDVYTEAWPTTFSSRFFADALPRPDSEIVKRWRRAGTVFIGKTNTPEFADDFVTEPTFRGATLNPWDLTLTVGGSIRVPAACCGLFGLKPSRGLNPLGPYFGEMGGGLNCEHVLSRSVRDSAAFLDATAGPEMGAPYRVVRPVNSYLQALERPSGRLRIACLAHRIDGARVATEIERRLAAAAAVLEDQGHEVRDCRFPAAVATAAAGEGWSTLWLIDIAMAIRDRTVAVGHPPGPKDIEQLPRYVMRRIERMSALEYLDVKRTAHQVSLAMAREFDDYDIVMTPGTGTLPPTLGSIDSNAADFDFERWAAVTYGFAPFSEIFNVTGQPAASLPMFHSDSGMPIGIQLVGRQDQDHVLLRLAADLERSTDWTNRHPPLWAGRLPG
jgi:amidase